MRGIFDNSFFNVSTSKIPRRLTGSLENRHKLAENFDFLGKKSTVMVNCQKIYAKLLFLSEESINFTNKG